MKVLFLIALTSLNAVSLHASTDGNSGNRRGSNQPNAAVQKCLSGDADVKVNAGKIEYNEKCISIIYAAGYSRINEDLERDRAAPADRAFECEKKSPTNQDWEACQKAIKTYTTLIGLDKAMQMASGVQSQMASSKIQKEVENKAANGNLQTAALEATADKNKSDAAILSQQMYFYGSQAAALEVQVKAWPTKRKTVCNSKNVDANKKSFVTNYVKKIQSKIISEAANAKVNPPASFSVAGVAIPLNGAPSFGEADCEKILSKLNDSELFPNGNARTLLQNKAIEAVSKAVAAGINANKLRQNAKTAENLADLYNEDTTDAMVQLCAVDPTNVKCKGTGTRVNQAGYQAGDFNMGGNGAGQAFNLNPSTGTPEELGNAGTPEGSKVADITSPFADEAEKSGKLLDQVGGASYTSAGAGGGGAGGVGGGGGGGSAALGGDLQGADKDNKEAEIKASKRDGGYGEGGGGGFAAMGGGNHSDDENPLKSLFDQEGAKGGIEEDRSIASEDIDNSNSALFEKISKKYVKVHGERRIEANNLE